MVECICACGDGGARAAWRGANVRWWGCTGRAVEEMVGECGGAEGAGVWWDVVAWSGCEGVCASVLVSEFGGVLGRGDSVGTGLAVRLRFLCGSNSIGLGRAAAFCSQLLVLSTGFSTTCSIRSSIADEVVLVAEAPPSS